MSARRRLEIGRIKENAFPFPAARNTRFRTESVLFVVIEIERDLQRRILRTIGGKDAPSGAE